MFFINQPLLLQKTKSLYSNPIYLFWIWILIWPQRIKEFCHFVSIVHETNHKNAYGTQNTLSLTPFNPMFLTTQHFINGSHTQWPKMKAPQFFSWFIWSQTYCYLQLESHLITSIWKKAFWRFERRRVACTMAEIFKYSPNIKVYIWWEGHKNEQKIWLLQSLEKPERFCQIFVAFSEINQQKSVIVPFLECQSPIRFNWFEQTFQCLNISTK